VPRFVAALVIISLHFCDNAPESKLTRPSLLAHSSAMQRRTARYMPVCGVSPRQKSSDSETAWPIWRGEHIGRQA
jgi:hypothetical protein